MHQGEVQEEEAPPEERGPSSYNSIKNNKKYKSSQSESDLEMEDDHQIQQ